ncbi:MAG: carbohydrate kinase family protein [Thermoproteota archaeon]|nr:carbohydrate kinase family protein [Candidatus Brockarchaeota archaeon]MBO3768654.1 carbohydrate kinase family protein [Candidatus Brockarchaeota archaeon]MBO3801092.1 carbohydrate kinase family protein [Candidatus Brockarchaeota archaeon]
MVEVLTSGFIVADIIAADLPKIADPGRLIFAPRGIKLTIGGHPCNVSIDLIQLGLEKGSVGIVGAIGKDVFGSFVRNTLEEKGVVTYLTELSEVGTTKVLALVVKGEDRRFHADLGASWYLDPKAVSKIIFEQKPKIVYTASGICGKFDERLSDVLKTAKEVGSLTFVDMIEPYGKQWNYIIEHLEYADIFHCNDIELKNIFNKDSIESAMRVAKEKINGITFVTLGGKGALAVLRDGRGIRQSGFNVDVVDPTGAGDAFSAGIIYNLLTNKKLSNLSEISIEELKKLLMFGQATGAACVTGIGTTTSVTRENVNSIIDLQGEKVLGTTELFQV